MTALRRANRQCPSRRVRRGVPVRDGVGAMIGWVSLAAARSAVEAGRGCWRGRGRGRYLRLAEVADGGRGWMMPPSTVADGVGRLFATELWHHSGIDSWRLGYGVVEPR